MSEASPEKGSLEQSKGTSCSLPVTCESSFIAEVNLHRLAATSIKGCMRRADMILLLLLRTLKWPASETQCAQSSCFTAWKSCSLPVHGRTKCPSTAQLSVEPRSNKQCGCSVRPNICAYVTAAPPDHGFMFLWGSNLDVQLARLSSQLLCVLVARLCHSPAAPGHGHGQMLPPPASQDRQLK